MHTKHDVYMSCIFLVYKVYTLEKHNIIDTAPSKINTHSCCCRDNHNNKLGNDYIVHER